MSLKQRLGLAAEPVFLMDGSAFIYRGFFANRNMQRSDGFPTNSLVVVSRVLLRILREERPRYFAFVQDGKGPNFRHEIFPLYKANRDATPEDLVRQLDPIHRMVRALGLRLEVSQGCEADDCIASLAARFAAEHPVIIVSGDKDLKQCLGPNVYMWDPASKEEKLVSEADFTAESGVTPAQWPDVQALIGDTSDNIPGVPGIGPKTARQIFSICPSLEDIRDHFVLLPPKMQAKLQAHLENMFTWRELTTLRRDFCPGVTLDDLRVRPLDAATCALLTEEFELFALRRELAALDRLQAAEADLPEEFLDAGSIREDAQPAAGKKAAAEQASLPLAQPARSGRATSQMSLLDAMPQESAPALDDVSALPDCGDARVALIWAHGDREAPYLAVEGADGSSLGEWQWKGPVAELARWLAPARTLVTADLKGLLTSASCWQFLAGRAGDCIDLGVAAYLLNPEENDYGWPRLSARWGAVLRHELESRGETAPGPARLGLAMAQLFEQRMEKDGLLELFRRLEMPLLPVLAGMEQSGVAIDAAAFRAFLDDVQGRLDQLTAHVYELAGTQFNIRSAQQLGDVLFNGLGLPAPRKTKGGQASTSQQTLEKLAGQHPVVDSILQYRKLEKMRSTYLDPLPRLVDPQGRIHTTFNQKATATGRLSSSNPNLQNIPVRGPLGKRMRSCFIAGPGRLLVSADYSQVELRVLAHVSQDPALLEAFRNGEDIHARTAALVYDLPPDQVSPDQRRNAKTINFGLIYGMGAQKLAQELKISTTQAKDFIARYFERLQGLKEFYEGVEASARKHGFVTTLGGRRRLLPDINSASGQAAALARRQAINTVIQGSAADIIKLAMLAVARDERLRELDARLLLQVHDELLLEVPADAAEEAGALVARLMQDVCPAGKELSVPLLVDWGTGHDWGAAH
ncbi:MULTISPECIES: DNA polymerase I [Desulfovibrio]|uniref:DNA polymerase I n=1 Tax=Desulfovibrio TaxID=872 RepID=UPI0026EB86C3|nr:MULTISPECIES: DNA polymerase I [Desulfovibrio]MDY2666407.1 DNA polymerase I [Desulfovibrio sp.]MDY5394273.1 DNA polymerase I [Desulfovibrio sp.]